jgi:hypothetical protein
MNDQVPGSELRTALKARGCALGADEARALAVSLIDLICLGLVVVARSERPPGASHTGGSTYMDEDGAS